MRSLPVTAREVPGEAGSPQRGHQGCVPGPYHGPVVAPPPGKSGRTPLAADGVALGPVAALAGRPAASGPRRRVRRLREPEQAWVAERPLEEFPSRSIRAAVRTRFLVLVLLPLTACTIVVPAVASQCGLAPRPGIDWRRCLLEQRSFAGADLTGAVLRDASLTRSDLSGAKLVRVDGRNARFVATDLRDADLSGAMLLRADLTRAELAGARLVGADLRRTHFYGADLRGADLTRARLDGADLLNATLEGARWIDGARICGQGSVGSCQ